MGSQSVPFDDVGSLDALSVTTQSHVFTGGHSYTFRLISDVKPTSQRRKSDADNDILHVVLMSAICGVTAKPGDDIRLLGNEYLRANLQAHGLIWLSGM